MTYSDMVRRIVTRHASAVLKFPARHMLTIRGRKYITSDVSPIGEISEKFQGARIVQPPEGSQKPRYLWVFDEDRGILASWSINSGSNKAYGRPNPSMLVMLEKKRHLNRVDRKEFAEIDRFMEAKEREYEDSLRAWVEDLKTEADHQIDKIVKRLYDQKVRPKLEVALRDIQQGAHPLGFKFDPTFPRSREYQAGFHVFDQLVTKFFSQKDVEAAVAAAKLPHYDEQQPYWARGDVIHDEGEALRDRLLNL